MVGCSTGMMPLTSGSAHIFGFDVNTQVHSPHHSLFSSCAHWIVVWQMEEIRQFLGVCPQHDILFDGMTVRVCVVVLDVVC